MAEEPTDDSFVRGLVEKSEALGRLEETVAKRMASFNSSEEQAEADALIKRAFNPQCAFDRKHTIKLILLVISPHEVSWHFKLRERLHHIFRHH